jgi:pimeloyl-ACP methyl ester carboxylesterase
VRQPQVAPLAGLLLALVLVAPVVHAAASLVLAAAFLVEFLGGGRPAVLTALTPAPERVALPVTGWRADRYARAALTPRPLVLVHGVTPRGKDDPLAVDAARLLARAGFDVAVPTVPGLTTGRLRPGDVEPVVATIDALWVATGHPVTLVGVSVGAGPALLAAADERVRTRVAAVLSLGGYASARSLVRFFLTGDHAWGDVRGHVDHDPGLVRAFVDANGDLVDDATRRALADGDRARAAALIDAPPPTLARLLDALSPERVATRIEARLVLVHGRGDRAVPFTESLRMAAARPERTRVLIVGVVDHVERAGRGVSAAAWRDLAALAGIVYSLLAQP